MSGLLDGDDLSETIIDPAKNYLEDLVGEGKKFKTPEDLARGKAESDAFIARLQREQQRLRDDLRNAQATKRLEEMLDQLSNIQNPPSNVDTTPREPETDKSPKGLTSDDVLALLEKKEAERKRENNLRASLELLQKKYGENYSAHVKEAARKMGIGTDFLDSVAASNPTAFAKLMDLEEVHTSPDVTPPRSSVQPSFKPSSNVKNWNYYESMRKADPNRYHSVSIQKEMHDEAVKAFRENRDFYA